MDEPVALAAQLRDIPREHRLDRRGPSPQAEPIKAPLDVSSETS